MNGKQNSDIFFKVVMGCYFLSLLLSFLRIYVFHDYPVYYNADDIPDFEGEIQTAISEFHL